MARRLRLAPGLGCVLGDVELLGAPWLLSAVEAREPMIADLAEKAGRAGTSNDAIASLEPSTAAPAIIVENEPTENAGTFAARDSTADDDRLDVGEYCDRDGNPDGR